jgi:hypothetical protein
LIMDKYSFTKLKMGKWENGRLKTIIWQSCWQSTPRGNDHYKGATLCLEGKIDPF